METQLSAARVSIRKGKAKPFWYGHPLVFSGAIQKVDGSPEAGECVDVLDQNGNRIGWGVFNPHSDYRVRLLCLAEENAPDYAIQDLVKRRLEEAVLVRRSIGLPSDETNAFRLFNSEGDRLSGLTIDCFGDVLVVASSALWVEKYRTEIEAAMRDVTKPRVIVWRQVNAPLRQDGVSEIIQTISEETVTVRELGVNYQVALGAGQKTGFYFDQRENRALIRSLAHGRSVLDVCCYTGGFALNAARGGATNVVAVDSSAPAIGNATANAALNGIENVEFVCADAIEAMQGAEGASLVVLDPPKLARTERDLHRAIPYYRELNKAALECLGSGGLLFTCSCSAAVSVDLFLEMLRDAAHDAHRRISLLKITRAAADHPLLPAFPEGDYLKCFLVAVA